MEDRGLTKLYGECAYLLDEIFKICEKMGGWDELVSHLDSIDDYKFKNEQDLYFRYYKFLKNVYWRISRWTEPQPFNKVSRIKLQNGKDGYRIWNYNYQFYCWTLDHGYTEYMNTSMVEVPKDKLTAAEVQRFERRIDN